VSWIHTERDTNTNTLRESQDYDPFTIKNILMSTATDLKNDPFTQGAGLVNVSSALDYVNGKDGLFIVHNDASYQNIKKILDPAISKVNSTEIGFEQFQLPSTTFPMTSWFAGQLLPGERSSATFTVVNTSENEITLDVIPKKLSLISKNEINRKTIVTTPRMTPVIHKISFLILYRPLKN